jgi:hypothetical protein
MSSTGTLQKSPEDHPANGWKIPWKIDEHPAFADHSREKPGIHRDS